MTTEQIDRLYPAAPAPAAGASCPEAALSLCLKGRIRGTEAQLTVRGSTREEFLTNVLAAMDVQKHIDALTVLFDDRPGTPPAAEHWCHQHGVAMHETIGKTGARWYSHRTSEGWCKGRLEQARAVIAERRRETPA